MRQQLVPFISGGLVMSYLVAGLFFLRFWRDTRDRFFVYFTLAFGILAVQRLSLTLFVDRVAGAELFIYGLRAAAFLLIIAGIIDKNREQRP